MLVANGAWRMGRRIIAMAAMFVFAALCATAQIQHAGNLLVSLDADDFTSGDTPSVWTNHGSLGDFSVTGAVTPLLRGILGPNQNKGMWFGPYGSITTA